MLGIISALSESNLFSSIDVVELIDEDLVKLIRIKAKVLDGTILYVTELTQGITRNIPITGRRRMGN